MPTLIEDVGRGKRWYVYSHSRATKKGANRYTGCLCNVLVIHVYALSRCACVGVCGCVWAQNGFMRLFCFIRFATLLWNILKANRECGTEHALARELYIIGDNYSETRNWCSCMHFATELIWRKWFDEVFNLFGPVGHTHNGLDACHNQHNTDLLLSVPISRGVA